MKRIIFSLLGIILAFNLSAQNISDSTQLNQKYTKQEQPNQEQPKQTKQKSRSSFKLSKIFIGGNLGLTFGSVTSVRINPLIGYNLTPKLSAGITGLYEYNSYETYYGRQNYSNYGGSVFSRFRVIPQLYAQAEFSYISYEQIVLGEDRTGVPFLFLGGGYAQRIGGNTFAYAQILFDVLQDKNSPYADWAPFYSVGVSVGF